MKIIIDDKIPYIKGAFEAYADVEYLSGNATTPDVVKNADVLVTRTRTICNEALLKQSSVKLIATATIGYDHIDTHYCKQAGISWTNAPGCNSGSVEQYIASVLMVLFTEKLIHLPNKCIGIIGVGNVGSKVERLCRILGMKVLLYDPPRERAEGSVSFTSLQEIQHEADIISLHVPLVMSGEDATFHLADEAFFNNLRKKPVFINTCRGEVVDTEVLKMAVNKGLISSLVVDCWENEPNIDYSLMDACFLATPHIAGYSRDGKANGTKMCVNAIYQYFGLSTTLWEPSGVEAPDEKYIHLNGEGKSAMEIVAQAILHTYNVRTDDKLLRENPLEFENQRGNYPVRREFHAYTVCPKNVNKSTLEMLKKLRFNLAS